MLEDDDSRAVRFVNEYLQSMVRMILAQSLLQSLPDDRQPCFVDVTVPMPKGLLMALASFEKRLDEFEAKFSASGVLSVNHLLESKGCPDLLTYFIVSCFFKGIEDLSVEDKKAFEAAPSYNKDTSTMGDYMRWLSRDVGERLGSVLVSGKLRRKRPAKKAHKEAGDE